MASVAISVTSRRAPKHSGDCIVNRQSSCRIAAQEWWLRPHSGERANCKGKGGLSGQHGEGDLEGSCGYPGRSTVHEASPSHASPRQAAGRGRCLSDKSCSACSPMCWGRQSVVPTTHGLLRFLRGLVAPPFRIELRLQPTRIHFNASWWEREAPMMGSCFYPRGSTIVDNR